MEKRIERRRTPTPFAQRVYALCRQIPQGKVSTYKELARALDCKSAQAIGQALRCNPYAPMVPCHRVVASDGSLGGFKGETKGKCITEKQTLLRKEGVIVDANNVNLKRYLHTFSTGINTT
ncbi:MGMT family protein [Candidatus Woesearchaeota archaeon]|nr:MGMT family protein [Candidatus Woesearchaeota archaeon]